LVTNVLTGLLVDEQRMLKNMELTQGRMMSEAVMLALSRKGMGRQEAHELIRGLALKSDAEKRPFKQILVEDGTVQKMLSGREVDEALDPRNYLGTALKQVELVVKMTKRERKARGLAD
jgi:adenylosuccinate lyase